MTGWTKAYGQDDSQNNGGNSYPNEEFPPPSSTKRGSFRIFDVLFSKWQTLQLFERLYVLALVVLVAGLVVVRISSNSSYYVYGAAPLASLA